MLSTHLPQTTSNRFQNGLCVTGDNHDGQVHQPHSRFLGRVFHADALDMIGRLPTESIDAVIADPMYGAVNNATSKRGGYEWGYDPSGGDPEKHWSYHKPIYEECRRVLKPGGILAWASSAKYAGTPMDGKYNGLNKKWFGPHTEWVLGRRCRKQCQFTSHLWVVQTKEQEPVTGLESSVIFYDRMPHPPKGYPRHPCPKPWEELSVVIKALTKPGEVVLDCFAGTGSTLVAAERLGRLWIGCDKSRYYCQLAMRELAKVRRERTPSA